MFITLEKDAPRGVINVFINAKLECQRPPLRYGQKIFRVNLVTKFRTLLRHCPKLAVVAVVKYA